MTNTLAWWLLGITFGFALGSYVRLRHARKRDHRCFDPGGGSCFECGAAMPVPKAPRGMGRLP